MHGPVDPMADIQRIHPDRAVPVRGRDRTHRTHGNMGLLVRPSPTVRHDRRKGWADRQTRHVTTYTVSLLRPFSSPSARPHGIGPFPRTSTGLTGDPASRVTWLRIPPARYPQQPSAARGRYSGDLSPGADERQIVNEQTAIAPRRSARVLRDSRRRTQAVHAQRLLPARLSAQLGCKPGRRIRMRGGPLRVSQHQSERDQKAGKVKLPRPILNPGPIATISVSTQHETYHVRADSRS